MTAKVYGKAFTYIREVCECYIRSQCISGHTMVAAIIAHTLQSVSSKFTYMLSRLPGDDSCVEYVEHEPT